MSKYFEVLLREHGRRRQDRYLFTVHDRFERGANRHLGFAKTDVAADQAIHRTRTFHIDLGIDDRLRLVRRFAERKGMLEFRLPFRIRAERVSGMRLTLGLKRKHFTCIIED